MAHTYSAAIHHYLSDKIAAAETNAEQAKRQNDNESYHFYRGQLEELYKIREYLTARIDLQTQKYY